MKCQKRGLEFWRNFRYCVKIEQYFPDTGKTETKFVVDVDWSDKTTSFITQKEAAEKGMLIQFFDLETAVELMNGLYLNGHRASIAPLV